MLGELNFDQEDKQPHTKLLLSGRVLYAKGSITFYKLSQLKIKNVKFFIPKYPNVYVVDNV